MNNYSNTSAPFSQSFLGDTGVGERNIITAISTAPGMGAIAVIRLSGEGCFELVDSVFQSPSGKKLAEQKANTIHFGKIIEDDEVLDEVLVSLFRAPHSFTGEDSVEISCHGSVYIQQQLMRLLLSKGANLAQPGEFTRRGFKNGKFDLSQAEAVADLISSTSKAAHHVAMNQMRGGFATMLNELRAKLLQFVSLIELELDFSEEDVEFANREKLCELTVEIRTEIEKLVSSFQLGNVIKNGIPVAIIGETNAGKSTLLNAFLKEEKAIVSDIHGTTRDVIEDTVNINGIMFRFIDTAGIRETTDAIESLGIERTFKKIEHATIILWVIDITSSADEVKKLSEKLLPMFKNTHSISILNKADKLTEKEIDNKVASLQPYLTENILTISSQDNNDITRLQKLLLKQAEIPAIGNNDVIVTNIRHMDMLSRALEAIHRVEDGLEIGITGDFLSQDIRECMFYLGEITGQITTDEILGNIFSKFCIGK